MLSLFSPFSPKVLKLDITELISFKDLHGAFHTETDIQAYLNREVNLRIYQEINEREDWIEDFEPLDFFNLLYSKRELFYTNNKRPLDILQHLRELKLVKKNIYILWGYLIDLIKDDFKKANDGEIVVSFGEPELGQDQIALRILVNEFDKLGAELHPISTSEKDEKFDFEKVKMHLKTLQSYKEKIEYLITIRTEYQQSGKADIGIIGSDFSDRCKLEIKKLKELSKLNIEPISYQTPKFKLSTTKGAKIDLIRVLFALYEMRLIVKEDDQLPTKQKFMETFGELVGKDFSKYDVDISQSLRNQNLNVNLKIFNKMIDVIKNNHHLTKENK